MRYSDIRILLEYDRSKTVQRLGDKIAARAQTEPTLRGISHESLVDTVMQEIEQSDPTRNKQFVIWIVTQYAKGQIKFEDIYKLKDDLTKFADPKFRSEMKRRNINADINQYTPRTLVDLINQLSSTELATGDDETGAVEDVKVLYDGPLGKLSIPETEAASCELGRGTRWCTAASNKNRYDYYNQYGPLYVWHDRKRKQKYQFHFETGQFMDAQDRALTAEDARYFMKENPVTSKLFQKNEPKMDEVLDHFVNYVNREPEYDDDYGEYRDYAPSEIEELAADANFEFLLYSLPGKDLLYYYKKATDELGFYIRDIVKKDSQKRKEFEDSYIKGSPSAAQNLAEKFYKGPAPHLEDLIAQDGKSSYLYAFHSLNKGRFEKGEPAIAKDTWAATMYATKILKQRWPEGEPAIKKSPANWKEYQTILGLTD